jgi:hypothetical protein
MKGIRLLKYDIMNWSKEDIELVEKFIEIKNKGFYCDSKQLTEVYNRVLDKRVSPTNCGSCIRQRVNELEGALNHFKRLSEASNVVEVDNIPQEENKALRRSGKGKH